MASRFGTSAGLCLAVGLGVASIVTAPAFALGPGAVRDTSAFVLDELPPNDDESTTAAPIGFPVGFFGTTYGEVYVNNNGNLTFGAPLSEFTPVDLTMTEHVIIAAFWADVDTNGAGSVPVTYGTGSVNGRPAFVATWAGVGYFFESDDKLNHFQIVLVDRSDIRAGDFDFELNYDQILWETGDFSGGVSGFGGFSARAGYSNGTRLPGTFVELPGSGIPGALLDGNPATGLIHSGHPGPQLGRYVFEVRNGTPNCRSDGECDDSLGCTLDTCAPVAGEDASVRRCSNVSTCQPVDDCHEGVCSVETGTCVSVPRPDGSACEDGDRCGPDTCQAGVCADHELCGVVTAPIVTGPRKLNVGCRGDTPAAAGDFCEAQGFAAVDERVAAAGVEPRARRRPRPTPLPPPDGFVPITKPVRRDLSGDAQVQLKLRLNRVGKRLLKDAKREGRPLAVAVQVRVQNGGRVSLLKRLVDMVRK
jgi:hypothetical protein